MCAFSSLCPYSFAKGTLGVAEVLKAITERGATTVVGGGDSVAAIEQMGYSDKVSHVSTGTCWEWNEPSGCQGWWRETIAFLMCCVAGGGATLELLGGDVLPGVAAIHDA